ncbi:alginate O-acetyltransferase AlgX-related protein [Hyphococcus sp.]|uniref:alginate O-acetyltransferase AlgX-related protein n=1 Tax=Hyphococcus sp. TaxID=2038636 RepID=UPI0035C67134
MRRFTYNRIAAALFLALLSTPLCVQLFSGGASISMAERRALAPFPSLNEFYAAPLSYPDKLSRWMEDHLGLRGALTKLYSKLRDELHLEDRRFAVRGDDGWLFLALDQALLSHQGLNPFAPGEAETWFENAKRMKDASCGKPFTILIAPDKHTVYSEKLSRYPRRSGRATRLETLAALAPEFGIAVSAPVEALRDAKRNTQVYYRTNSHWTFRGAYEGYRAIAASLKQQGLSIETVDPSRLEPNGEHEAPQDIYGLLGVENPPPEMTPNWRIKNAADVIREDRLEAYDWRSFEAKRWTSSKEGAPRLIVFGDSFFNALRPFLTESFSSVAFVHHRMGEPPFSALQSCDYDAVVFEIVERQLSYPLVFAP